MFTNSDNSVKTLSNSEKFEIGFLMKTGVGYEYIKKKYKVSRSYAYGLREYAEKCLYFLDEHDPYEKTFVLTKDLEKRITVALGTYCHSSLEGIYFFFKEVLHTNISTSKASGILKEAALKAAEWDETIPLNGIKACSSDEIFQNDTPVLVTIASNINYICTMEEKEDRKADTWKSSMEELKAKGLDLKVSISDQGTGLLSGIPKAFPDAEIQYDIFHEEMEFQKHLSKLEDKAFSLIKDEYDLERKAMAANGAEKRKLATKLKAARDKSSRFLRSLDEIRILFGWLKELFGFSGYSPEECMELAKWITSSMGEAAINADMYHFLRIVRGLEQKLPNLLNFVKRLFQDMDVRAQTMHVPAEAFHRLYHLRTHPSGTQEHRFIEKRAGKLFKGNKEEAKNALKAMINETTRASSMVENTNSHIRPFIDLKRHVPRHFFSLIKVYLNTKEYRRSVIAERVGKSPYELLTGEKAPRFLDIVCA